MSFIRIPLVGMRNFLSAYTKVLQWYKRIYRVHETLNPKPQALMMLCIPRGSDLQQFRKARNTDWGLVGNMGTYIYIYICIYRTGII